MNIFNPDLHESAPEHSRCSQFRYFHVEVHTNCEEKGQPRSDLIHLIFIMKMEDELCDEKLLVIKMTKMRMKRHVSRSVCVCVCACA